MIRISVCYYLELDFEMNCSKVTAIDSINWEKRDIKVLNSMLEFTIIYDISRFVRNWELIMHLDREIEKCSWIMKLRNVKKV